VHPGHDPLDYATDKEREQLEAYLKHGSYRRAAAALGVSHQAIVEAVQRIERRAGMKVPRPEKRPSYVEKGRSTLFGHDGEAGGLVTGEWVKTTREGMHPDDAYIQPDPKLVKRTATYTNSEGRVIGQWVTEERDAAKREQLWRTLAQELADNIPRAAPIPHFDPSYKELLAVLPVGDHHTGMLAWKYESGESWDLEIAETVAKQVIDYLVAASPPCGRCLLPFLGDFFHYDGLRPETPQHRNLLDADGRYQKMARVGLRIIRYAVERCLEKHATVHIIFEIGNHDESTAQIMSLFLDALYENEPRVTVDTSPARYHYYRFGENLIGTHHGDAAKPNELPGIMAADRPQDWGATKHRIWFTGHVHSRRAWDFPGCAVESMRVLPPADAYAAKEGYRSIRGMTALVMHQSKGEVMRLTATPDMFDPAPPEEDR
jgi:hypothetical protein